MKATSRNAAWAGTTIASLGWLVVAGLAAGVAPSLAAQGTAADYDRAARTPARLANTIFRDRVEPNWLPEDRAFWYRVTTGRDRARFVFVDCQARTRRDAFDHDAVARFLSKTLGRTIAPDRLPFRTIDVDPDTGSVSFRVERRTFTTDPATGDVTASDVNVPPDDETGTITPSLRPPRSGSGEQTIVRFVNRLDRTVRLFWQPDGGPPRHYHDLPPGQTYDQNTYVGHVWRVADENGQAMLFFRSELAGVAVVSDATLTAARAERPARREGDGPDGRRGRPGSPRPQGRPAERIETDGPNLVLIESATGQRRRVTEDGTEADAYSGPFVWSPDGAFVIARRIRAGQPRTVSFIESSPRDGVQPKLHQFHYDKPGDVLPVPRVCLVDVAAGRVVELDESSFDNAWSIDRIAWWPDSSAFTFLYNERGHKRLAVIEVATDGTVRDLINETSETFVCYSSKLYYRRLDDTREILWMSERDGYNHLYRIDGHTGQVLNPITSGPWVVRDVESVDEQARRITVRAGGIVTDQSPYHIHRVEVGFDGSELVRLTDGDGTHDWQDSPTGRYLIDRFSRVDAPPVTVLRDRKTGEKLVDLETADITALMKTDWQMPERFVAPGRDGETPIYGIIIRPSHFDPSKTYPVIEDIYAGPQGFFVPQAFSTHSSKSRLAELGFIVVQIDGMGTSGRSKAFHDVCYKNLADAGLPDRRLWLAAAAKAHPEMDLSRVGIFGGSAGGQNAVSALLHQGDTYHVGVADCGCHDNRMDKVWWNEQWMGWPVDASYEQSSNVVHASKLTGRLMLVVGEVDRNVDPASTMQVADALIRADKDFDLLVMPGVGHGALGHPYAQRRMYDFFVRHLHGVEPRR